MWSWLTNAWVIGIGGGIVSGALVTWIANSFLAKKENREYVQKLVSANHEIIYAIRPGIPEGQVPTREVISDLISSTARRYGVSSSDLYSHEELVQELVKEVMDSSFLSTAKKAEYCKELAPLRTPIESREPERKDIEYQLRFSEELYRKRKQTSERASILLGVIAAIGSIAFTFRTVGIPTSWLGHEKTVTVLFEVLIGVGTAVAIAIALYAMERAASRRRAAKLNATIEEDLARIQDQLEKRASSFRERAGKSGTN